MGPDATRGAGGPAGLAPADLAPRSLSPAGRSGPRAVLAMVMVTAMLASLDTSSVAVALPSIVRDLDSTLGATQWVVTGYLLVFGALLLAGGRLGDMYGHRRTLIAGVALFGTGSLLAGEANSLPALLLPRALLCGMGVALVMPATGSLLSLTFQGHARAKAFATWGAVVGGAAAFGPVLGGYLTSHHSWRWCFRVNVVASVAVLVLAFLVLSPDRPARDRGRLDVAGVLLSAGGMLLLVTALSEAGDHGWITPTRSVVIGQRVLWSSALPVSVVPCALAAATLCFGLFYRLERARERDGSHPLVAFGELGRRPGFRYGVVAASCVAMGQYGLVFVLPIFLQESLGLSASQSGSWQLVPGGCIVAGAVVGARLARPLGSLGVVKLGLALEAAGLLVLAATFGTGATLVTLLPGFLLFGLGVGAASAQVSNVVVTDVAGGQIGIASATNSIARQLGSVVSASLIASLLAAAVVAAAAAGIESSSALPPATRDRVVEELRSGGLRFERPEGLLPAEEREVASQVARAVGSGSRAPLVLAGGVSLVGLLVAWRIPREGPRRRRSRALERSAVV